jgi:hypothetical protein
MNLDFRSIALCILFVQLCACGGGGGGGASGASDSSTSTAIIHATSLGAAISEALRSGAMPNLNHDSTITGVDANANGVRDDIDAYIASLPDTPAQKAVLLQHAAVLQATLTVDTSNQSALRTVDRNLMNSIRCIHKLYGEGIASRKSQDLEKFTVNTRIRLDAYEKFNSALSGTSISIPMTAPNCAQ